VDTILAKGPNFVFAREFIQQEYPSKIWVSLMNQLSEEDRRIWRSATLDQAYPFTSFKAGVFALASLLDSLEIVETARMYEYIAERSLNTLYKALFHFTNPAYVIQNYPRLWEKFFTTGTVEANITEERRAVVTFKLPEIFIDWLPPACVGYSRKAIELAGGQHFTIRQLEKYELEDDCWLISYEMGWL
jgi:hypothetical protein